MSKNYRKQDARKKFLEKRNQRNVQSSRYHVDRKQNSVKLDLFGLDNNNNILSNRDEEGGSINYFWRPDSFCKDRFAANGDPLWGAKLTRDEGCTPQPTGNYDPNDWFNPPFTQCGQEAGEPCSGDGKWNMVQTGYHDGYHGNCGYDSFWYGSSICWGGGAPGWCTEEGCNSHYAQYGIEGFGHAHYRPETLDYWGGGNAQWGDMNDWGELLRGTGVHETDWNMMMAQGVFIPKPSPNYPSGSIRTHKFVMNSDDGLYLSLIKPKVISDVAPDGENGWASEVWNCWKDSGPDDINTGGQWPGTANVVQGSCNGICAEEYGHQFPTQEGHAGHYYQWYGDQFEHDNAWGYNNTGDGILTQAHAHGDNFEAYRCNACYINLMVGRMYKMQVKHHNETGQKYINIRYSHADMGDDYYRLHVDQLSTGNNNHFCDHAWESNDYVHLKPSKYEFKCCNSSEISAEMPADNPIEGLYSGIGDIEGNLVCGGYEINWLREQIPHLSQSNLPHTWDIYHMGMHGDMGVYVEQHDTTCYCNPDVCYGGRHKVPAGMTAGGRDGR